MLQRHQRQKKFDGTIFLSLDSATITTSFKNKDKINSTQTVSMNLEYQNNNLKIIDPHMHKLNMPIRHVIHSDKS